VRKRLIALISKVRAVNAGCLDFDRAAVVEVASEEKDYPVEAGCPRLESCVSLGCIS
jgi:hypothetical protein